jgi:endonuclease G
VEIDRTTRAHARLALRKAVGAFLFEDNINMIDFGLKESEGHIQDRPAIRFHVQQKLSGVALEAAEEAGRTRPIPREFEGFETDVPEGQYHTQPWPWGSWSRRPPDLRAQRAQRMAGGISISNERHYTFATLGGLVRDRTTGQHMILSNWHVLAGDWIARPGQRIYQPGWMDGGTAADTVATLTRDAMAAHLDAAVAALTGARPLVNNQWGVGPVTGVDEAVLGANVLKSGRKTAITYGRVVGIDGVAKLPYHGVTRLIRHVITIDPRRAAEEVSAGGDSGSWWLDQATRKVVGLHFAGSNFPEHALAIDMPAVLAALRVHIVV